MWWTKIFYVCTRGSYDDKKSYEVRDHCHYIRKYRNGPHNICTLRYKIPKKVPVVFHNVSDYDYHFIIES